MSAVLSGSALRATVIANAADRIFNAAIDQIAVTMGDCDAQGPRTAALMRLSRLRVQALANMDDATINDDYRVFTPVVEAIDAQIEVLAALVPAQDLEPF